MSYCLFLAQCPPEKLALSLPPFKLSVVENVHIFVAEISHFQEFITLVLRLTNGMHSPYFKAFFQSFNAEKLSLSLPSNSNKAVDHFKGMMASLYSEVCNPER